MTDSPLREREAALKQEQENQMPESTYRHTLDDVDAMAGNHASKDAQAIIIGLLCVAERLERIATHLDRHGDTLDRISEHLEHP